MRCEVEPSRILSNWRSLDIWQALEKLIIILLKDSGFSSFQTLYAWKQAKHLALANEPYAWRAALEEIKNSDLSVMCAGVPPEDSVLMADKPVMLKVAGEITNALMHSYDARHRVSFVQRTSNVPS